MPAKSRCKEDKYVIKSFDVLGMILALAIRKYKSAEVAVLHLLDEYDFPPYALENVLSSHGLEISFSNVAYYEIAPFVGLDPAYNLRDIGTFELHRSRMPTSLVKTIAQDMAIMQMRYGPLSRNMNAETISRMLSPIFNHLIAQFNFSFINRPKFPITGQITTNGRIEHYFRAFGRISVIVIEIKLDCIGDDDTRMDAIGQVIAECNACDWTNSSDSCSIPVFGILWDGSCFHFFKFEGNTKPYTFLRGVVPGSPPYFQRGFMLPDYKIDQNDTFPFLAVLRQTSETLFDLLLCSYISSLNAFCKRIELGSTWREDLDQWKDALKSAQRAQEYFRDGETKRQVEDIIGANEAALKGQETLRQSVETAPMLHDRLFLMSGWDDNKIDKV